MNTSCCVETEEGGVTARGMVVDDTILRAYRKTLDTNRPADIGTILDAAAAEMDPEDLAQLRTDLIAAWLAWQAVEQLKSCSGP